METWKTVQGYERYEVSNHGRVRSTNKKGKTKILKPQLNHSGYYRVWLSNGGKIKRCLVHRLVASAFIPNPEGHPQINHIDFKRTNNRVENLEWITHKDNCQYSAENARKSALNAKQPQSGHHYIYKRGNKYKFSVIIKHKYKTKMFDSLIDAIKYRDQFMVTAYENE